MEWLNKAEAKEPYSTYEGIARITQINDTIVALDEEISKLSKENTEMCATKYDFGYVSTPKVILGTRTHKDTTTFLNVQKETRLAALQVLKDYKTTLEQEAKTIMKECLKE